MHSFELSGRPPVHHDPECCGCNFAMQQIHRKIHGPWWLLCHCVSAASCRQKLWLCDRYCSISHYTICSLHSALSLPVQHLTVKQLFSTQSHTSPDDVADSAYSCGSRISNTSLCIILLQVEWWKCIKRDYAGECFTKGIRSWNSLF